MTYRGAARTIDGTPCKRCGGTLRYASSRACVPCDRLRKKIPLTPEQKREKAKKLRAWKDKNRERYLAHRRTSRYKIYGLDERGFGALLKAQGGKCPGCERELREDKSTNIDHDHATGKVRGLLCMSCNIALGMARDSVETLLRLGVYLEKHGG
jgi:transcription initiation factor IIE alpha subunit